MVIAWTKLGLQQAGSRQESVGIVLALGVAGGVESGSCNTHRALAT